MRTVDTETANTVSLDDVNNTLFNQFRTAGIIQI